MQYGTVKDKVSATEHLDADVEDKQTILLDDSEGCPSSVLAACGSCRC